MNTQKIIHKSKPRASSKKLRLHALSVCPADGAGWCPYPFSPAQLAKRLKLKIEQSNTKKEVLVR